jgi:predicted FMN-binding regulatory protein PaiB
MYQPPHFREDRLAVQHALIRAHPLGLIITAGPAGLQANPAPFLLDSNASEKGTVRAHLTRAPPSTAGALLRVCVASRLRTWQTLSPREAAPRTLREL